AAVLVATLMVGEIAAAVVAGSLALLADAGHLLTDVGALALALVAASMAARPPRGRFTFGFSRLEILAAQANGIALVLVGVWIVYAAVRRLVAPPDVRGGVVLVVAALVFSSAYVLLRESTRIFMEGSPGEIDPDEVGRALVAEPRVVEAHDLHVWTVTSGFPAFSAHVLVEPGADCHGVRADLE